MINLYLQFAVVPQNQSSVAPSRDVNVNQITKVNAQNYLKCVALLRTTKIARGL